ncbi:flippase-like domain-containing protein [Candidatus Saccharibacteria bacterium]|nr:flippase-like domain-containing protein [Candidatus Saccharibacteria bacterium]
MPEKTKNKTWKKPLLIALFIIFNIAVIAATAFAEFGKSKDATEISEISINWWLLMPAIFCFLTALTIDIHKYALMIRKMSHEETDNKHVRKVARRTVLLGKYYDNITPAAVGGQPFQMYYMRKNSGLSRGASTSIPIFGMISIQIAFIIIALLCFLFGNIFSTNPALFLTALFGLLFYAFWPVMVAGVTYFPKPTKKLIKTFIKVLAKLKIVKKRGELLEKVEAEADEYVTAVKTILKTRGLFIKVISWSLLYNILIAMIPFFVLTAFGGKVDFFSCFVTTIAVMSAIYFIPTPGNSGAAEGTFFIVFSALSSGYVFWAMLFWRFFSYYVYVILGPIIYFFMHLEKRKNL